MGKGQRQSTVRVSIRRRLIWIMMGSRIWWSSRSSVVGKLFLRMINQVSVLTGKPSRLFHLPALSLSRQTQGTKTRLGPCRAAAPRFTIVSHFTSHGFWEWRSLAVEVLFVYRSGFVLALRVYRHADLSARDRFSATVATDDGAFEVGRPAGIGPGACYEQVFNRTALDGSM